MSDDAHRSVFWTRLRDALRDEAPKRLPRTGRTPSAVTVPLFWRDGILRLLLTERSPHLPHHGGQISFPGGVPERGDSDLLATAIRETEEELGLGGRNLEVLAQIDDTLTADGFVITPFVVRLRVPFTLRVNREEISRTLTPALSEFRRPGNPRLERRAFQGRVWEVPFYACDEGLIWGATARIVMELLDRMERADLLPIQDSAKRPEA